jgi:hypothetical protein
MRAVARTSASRTSASRALHRATAASAWATANSAWATANSARERSVAPRVLEAVAEDDALWARLAGSGLDVSSPDHWARLLTAIDGGLPQLLGAPGYEAPPPVDELIDRAVVALGALPAGIAGVDRAAAQRADRVGDRVVAAVVAVIVAPVATTPMSRGIPRRRGAGAARPGRPHRARAPGDG